MIESSLRPILEELEIDVVHKNSRGWLVASCPFAPFYHEYGTDRDPSFFVKINPTGYSGYNCLSCHAKGPLTRLVTKLAHLREEDYDRLVIRVLRKEVPDKFEDFDEIRANACEDMDPLDVELYFRMYSNAWDDEAARRYLKSRGVNKRAAQLLELRFDPDAKRIMFPVYDFDKNLYGFTGRTILQPNKQRPKVRDYAGLKKDKCILGEHLINPELPIVLVEGLMAEAHLLSIGADEIANVVASMGSSLSRFQAGILTDYAKPVYLLYDLDKAGDDGILGVPDKRTGEREPGAFEILRKEVPTYICDYPKGVTDPDNFSIEDLEFAIENAYSDPAI
jgi:hypothetical protein